MKITHIKTMPHAAQRLSVEGYGRSQLLDPANPEGEVNRRVQVSNLGP